MKNKKNIALLVNFLLVLVIFSGIYLILKCNVAHYKVVHAFVIALTTLVITPRLKVTGRYPDQKYHVVWIWSAMFKKRK